MMGKSKLLAAALLLLSTAPVAMAQTVIATADGETGGTRIEITQLARSSGETATLKFRLVNDSSENASPSELMETSDLRNVHLIDATGKKKYLVLKDSEGKCVCSGGLSSTLEPGKSINLWARFPAPPPAVKEVSVIFPHFMPTDAPITD